MRLAITGQVLAKTHSLPHFLETVRSLDIDAVELWPGNLSGGETPEERDRYERKDLLGTRRVIESSGMTVACVTLGFGIMRGCTDRGPDYGAEALKGAVDAAAELGAPIVNCYLAGIAAELFVAAAQPAAEYAGDLGVTIVLENEAHDASGPSSSVRSIVDDIGSPHFGTQYDPCNYYQANEEAYPAAYEVIKDITRYVHLKGGCLYDAERRPRDHRGDTFRGSEHLYIGYTTISDGVVNVDGVLRRLADDGYDGFVTLEPHVPPEQAMASYRADVSYVRERLRQLEHRERALI